MRSEVKKTVFICHEASRTGATVLLLNFLKWLKKNTDIPFEIILKRGGELENEFRLLGPTFVFESTNKRSLILRISKRLGFDPRAWALKSKFSKKNVALIFSNTSTNGYILSLLADLNCPVISHIHELDYVIHLCGITDFQIVKRRTTHYIACSKAVQENLINRHSIVKEDVSVIHEFIPTKFASALASQKGANFLEKELGLPANSFIVGASGTMDPWRKGADLFIQLALQVHKIETGPIYFVWLGGGDNFSFKQDVEKAGLKEYVHFIPTKSEPQHYFCGFDIFVLPSREDPYPLVCLEAAALGKPILCFDKAGGEPEFVEDDCGFVTPYLDIQEMAKKVIELYRLPELRERLGSNAARKARERHALVDNAPKVLKLIEKYYGESVTIDTEHGSEVVVGDRESNSLAKAPAGS